MITSLLKLIFNLLKGITMWTIRQIISAIRFGTPWAIRMMLSILGAVFQLSMMSLASSVRGVPTVAAAIAKDWKERAIWKDFPDLWQVQLLQVFYVLAFCTIYLG